MTDHEPSLPQSAFSWASLLGSHRQQGRAYLEFLRSPSLSAGLYVLPAGATDEQQPHTEDEVYVILAGGARFTAEEASREVRAGDILYVAAGVPHRFSDITDELRIIVVFAPPEGSGRPDAEAATTGG